ncbi:hypothetical protein ACFSX9_02725 [Flavobacterium ardleyense]|uniref:DUF4304 domain-containing protein n=1 Tax=Flavobacterium ardleyense TaxID=2038737 RepID=A0ABW5Z5K9_9FLAO
MTRNWKEHIEEYLKSLNINYDKQVSGLTSFFITYYFNGIYLGLEFQNSTYLSKIEVGRKIDHFASNYKIIFDKRKFKNFRVKQNSFEIDSNINYELDFTETNKIVLDRFLKTLLEKGWSEKTYEIEEAAYRIKITIESSEYFISLKSSVEEDVPFLFDSFFRRVEDIWYNLNFNGKQKIIINHIEPSKKSNL